MKQPDEHVRPSYAPYGYYSESDLQEAVDGDAWIGTCLLNETTYSRAEMSARAKLYATQREYRVTFDPTDISFEGDSIATIYAIDDECALRFARQVYQPSAIATIEHVARTVEFTTIYEAEQ